MTTVDTKNDALIQKVLNENTETVVVRENLERRLRSGKQLRVKMGFDPSAPDIHIGHYVGLKKMADFQKLGHKIIIIVGDWTAQIGDPSERSAQRRMLSAEEVARNAQTYLDQFFNVVDPGLAEVRFQTTWFGNFDLADVLRLTARYTVARMLEREDFQTRYNAGSPIGIVEFLYPLLQAYDSVAVQSDIEIGGTDQTFNLLVGRDIQREMGQEPQDILTVSILVGTDGERKMSKSLGNYVGITDPANEMYGKLMSVPDSALESYLRLVTTFPTEQIDDMVAELASGNVNPRDIKDQMAANVIAVFHDVSAAEQARREFRRIFVDHEDPSDMAEVEVDVPATIVALLRQSGLAHSNNEARRLVEQGGVRLNQERIASAETELDLSGPTVLQAGRRRFVRLLPRHG
jgi:tyrosyl-tRNA synthetase